jgi:hypothetical protein
MTIGNSGKFYLTERDIQQNDTAVDTVADSIKMALFTNSITTPNFDTNTAYAVAPFNANEVATPSGGVAIAGAAHSVSTGTLVFDANDTAWGSQTFSTARAALGYDDTIAAPVAKPALIVITFGADFGPTAGIFTIQWAVGGIWTWDLTP